jgi:NadR type nicotinamide-nucleotide adenylyltransferase
MSRFKTGLVVGKFAPLHLGHELVINAARARCDHVVILSYSRPEFPGCEPDRRSAWLAARFPETTLIVLFADTETLPANSASNDEHRAFTADILRRYVDRPIDAVFTSEDYGPGFAADLARRQASPVAHIAIDAARSAVPVSGAALRTDIHGLRRFLSPEVYASFVERIALLGGESTGKSTLAPALADALATLHVAEYGRERWQQRRGQLVFDDLLAIAREQIRREDAAAHAPGINRFLVCDTTPLTTLFYSLDLFGHAAPELISLAERPYAHTILCADDFPFTQDGTRRDPIFRTHQQAWYRQQLANTSYHLASGPLVDRVRNLVLQLAPAAPASPHCIRASPLFPFPSQ